MLCYAGGAAGKPCSVHPKGMRYARSNRTRQHCIPNVHGGGPGPCTGMEYLGAGVGPSQCFGCEDCRTGVPGCPCGPPPRERHPVSCPRRELTEARAELARLETREVLTGGSSEVADLSANDGQRTTPAPVSGWPAHSRPRHAHPRTSGMGGSSQRTRGRHQLAFFACQCAGQTPPTLSVNGALTDY